MGRKVAPEALENIGATEMPRLFVIDGIEVPTDVVQRRYETTARVIQVEAKLEAAAPRKTAFNPVVPGVSISHPRITAGTAGCVVYDATTGAQFILSNWHVLNGPRGQIGDDVVQPGRHDDNRIDRNVVGKLVRSHLGVAGDCAIATVDHRRLSPEVVELGVAVTRIGEAELGDEVVKSGRTTGVTHGIVQRVHVVTRINYDEAGDHDIGCFEIGLDPDHPASGDEISMGGDSEAAWLSELRNAPTNMMLELHFAGEIGDEPKHALACYAGSVFEKLGIHPSPPAERVMEAAGRGYNANFIETSVPPPTAAAVDVRDDLLEVGGRSVVDYTHFSLAMSQSRRFARWVAWNIDGGALRRVSRRGIPFRKDPNLPADAQVGDEQFSNNPLDRGHLARRADLVWGPLPEARRANIDSFFFTNITPQHEESNQSDAGGIWGELENAIFADVDVEDLKVSVIGGPIFSTTDQVFRGVRLPKRFGKIIYYREAGEESVTAKGYVLTQEDLLNNLEVLELPNFAVFEVPISQIADMTGLELFAGSAPDVVGRRRRCEETTIARGEIRRIASIREIVG